MKTAIKQNLSARWSNPEHDGIVVGKMGHGDVSSWAHATSKPFGTPFKPVRPEVEFKREAFSPVRSLKAIKPVQTGGNYHDPKAVTMSAPNRFDENEHMSKIASRRRAIALKFESMYKQGIVSRSNVVLDPTPKPSFKSILDDCPASSREAIASLRKNEVPRD
jgi:hypothetical protein